MPTTSQPDVGYVEKFVAWHRLDLRLRIDRGAAFAIATFAFAATIAIAARLAATAVLFPVRVHRHVLRHNRLRRHLCAAALRGPPAVERVSFARGDGELPDGRSFLYVDVEQVGRSAVRVERHGVSRRLRIRVLRPLSVVRDVLRHRRGRADLRPAALRSEPAVERVAAARRRRKGPDRLAAFHLLRHASGRNRAAVRVVVHCA